MGIGRDGLPNQLPRHPGERVPGVIGDHPEGDVLLGRDHDGDAYVAGHNQRPARSEIEDVDDIEKRLAALERRADKNDLARDMRGLLDWAIETARYDLVRVDDVQAVTTGRAAVHEAALQALIAHAPDWSAVVVQFERLLAELVDDALQYKHPERWLAEYRRGVRQAAEVLLPGLRARATTTRPPA
jgi:hypothetical protein